MRIAPFGPKGRRNNDADFLRKTSAAKSLQRLTTLVKATVVALRREFIRLSRLTDAAG
jgi:hypothetical protein